MERDQDGLLSTQTIGTNLFLEASRVEDAFEPGWERWLSSAGMPGTAQHHGGRQKACCCTSHTTEETASLGTKPCPACAMLPLSNLAESDVVLRVRPRFQCAFERFSGSATPVRHRGARLCANDSSVVTLYMHYNEHSLGYVREKNRSNSQGLLFPPK